MLCDFEDGSQKVMQLLPVPHNSCEYVRSPNTLKSHAVRKPSYMETPHRGGLGPCARCVNEDDSGSQPSSHSHPSSLPAEAPDSRKQT